MTPHPYKQIPVPEQLILETIENLLNTNEFLRRHANPSVREDLRTYAITMGWDPTTGPKAFLDGISLDAHCLDHTLRLANRTPPKPYDR